MEKRISIIIPIYNAQKHIERCLQSIKRQSFAGFECILIDDGSIDDSANICAKYVNTDNRFLYYYKKNSGVSDTRNMGIKLASTDYIAFIDADDFVENDYLEALYEGLTSLDNPGLSLCQYSIDKSEASLPVVEVKLRDFGSIAPFFDEQNLRIVEGSAYSNSIWGSVWRCMFCKQIIEEYNISFKSRLRIHEDQVFVLEYINSINPRNIVYVERPLYHYTIEENGSSAINRDYISGLFQNDILYLDCINTVLQSGNMLSTELKEKCYSNISYQTAYKIISQEQCNSINVAVRNFKQFYVLGLDKVVKSALGRATIDNKYRKTILWLFKKKGFVIISILYRVKRLLKGTQ